MSNNVSKLVVSFKGLINSLMTTSNLWIALPLKFSKSNRRVVFRNGSILKVNWTNYCYARDFLAINGCKDCKIIQNDETFRVDGNGIHLSAPITRFPSVLHDIKGLHLTGYKITEQGNLNVVEGHGLKITSNLETLSMVTELFADLAYDCDIQGKVVLDVGAFHGESAVFFFQRGAKKVILYEPVKTHQRFIDQNITANHVDAEIHMEGIGETDGTQTIFYDKTDFNFGVLNSTVHEGENQMLIQTRNVSEVIRQSHADIAKFDCEGAEQTLATVDCNLLRTVSLYIIEIHSKTIREQLLHKFDEAGFNVIKDTTYSEHISVVFFQKAKKSNY